MTRFEEGLALRESRCGQRRAAPRHGHEASMIFQKATRAELDEIGGLYDAVCEDLGTHENYPGWKKGVYPTRDDAQDALKENALYVCKRENAVVGTVILRHKPEAGYTGVNWQTPDDYKKIYVVYTLAVRPDATGSGVGAYMMDAIEQIARAEGCIGIRLDVVKGNVPAEKLYRKCGYRYITTKSLGYEAYGLPWYDLYEKVL